MIIDDTKRNGWVRGRVLKVLTAADGRVRQAIVQTAGGAPVRKPTSKLAVLEVSKDGGTKDIDGFHRGEDVEKLATPPGRTTASELMTDRQNDESYVKQRQNKSASMKQ